MKTINLNTYYYKKSEIDDLLSRKANLTHMHGNITNDGFINNQASKNVVTDANGKITTEAKPTIPAANTTATNIKMNGTQSAGSLNSFAKADHVHPVDTSRAAASHTHDDRYYTETEINTKLNSYLTTSSATSSYQPKGNYVTTSAIKNDLKTGGASNVLSAEQGKKLKEQIDSIVNGETATDHNHDGRYIKTGSGTVTSDNIADKTIVNGDIADGTIETGKIKDSAITSAKIANGTIVNGDIANTTITGSKLVNGTITATQLASNAVETAKIKDANVTTAKIANGAVTNEKLSGTKITASSSSIVDLNNATYQKTGFYYCDNDNYAPYIIHCPWSNGTATPYTGNKSFFLLVEDWGTNNYSCKQTLTYYNGNSTFTRTKTNSTTWSSWKEHNTNNNDYLRLATRIVSGESAQIPANNIIGGGTDSKYHIVKSGVVLDPKYPILFNISAIATNSYTDNVYVSHTGVPLTNNVSGLTVTNQKQVYIEGTSYDGRQFVVSDRVFVSDDQISNLTDLGKYYIYIGVSYSTTNIRFNSFHQTVYVETRNGLVPVGDNTHNPHMLIKGDVGTAGYFKFLTIRTEGTYHDHTIEFDATHRGNKPKTFVSFNFNTYEKTSGSKKYYTNIQAFYYHGHPTPVYYIQTNDGVQDATFDFYIRRETWDEIGVSDLRSSINNYNGMTVTWHNEFVTALPSGTTQATLNPYYAQVGHTHGSVANNGTLNSDITSVNKVVVTDSNNSLKTISQIPYSKVSGTPTIPTKTSQLTNDSGFLTSHQSITGKADKTGGVAQVTDANANNYSNIGSLSSGATQQAINNAINTALGGKQASGKYLTSHNPVDTALSSTSTNAVQNKVVNTALNGKVAISQGKGNSGKFLKVNSSGNVACESVTIPSAYTHPSYTPLTGVPTQAYTLKPGATFNVSQPVTDSTGHVTALNARNYTLPKAPVFNHINATSSTTKNLNDYKTGGFYYCSSDTNEAPYITSQPLTSGQKSFFLLVETWGETSTYVKQTLTYHDNTTYTRTCSNNTWGGWQRTDGGNKANKTGGVAQVTDANANKYTNIGSLSSGATQQAINNAINTALGGKQASGSYAAANHTHNYSPIGHSHQSSEVLVPTSTVSNLLPSNLPTNTESIGQEIINKEINAKFNDTGLVKFPYNSNAQDYSSDEGLKIRKIGNIVTLGGLPKTKTSISAKGDLHIGTLSQEYRPLTKQYSMTMFPLGKIGFIKVDTDGKVYACLREDSTTTVGSGTYCVVNMTWMVD